jgi:bifunctional DNA-binding transcriptional regulator/antitoxin component of YhaV-PrlF toxin-antitoxin module
MKTVISSKGQIVLPAAIRQQDGIEPGQKSKAGVPVLDPFV